MLVLLDDHKRCALSAGVRVVDEMLLVVVVVAHDFCVYPNGKHSRN
jgi:hypothetical protein